VKRILCGALGALTALANPEVGELLPGVHLRVNLTKRLAVEADTSRDLHLRGLSGIYQLLATIGTDPAARHVVPFFTAGAAGFFERTTIPGRTARLVSGDVVSYPDYRRGRLSAPEVWIVGGGARFRGPGSSWISLAGHFWVAGDGGLIGVRCALDLPFGPRRVGQ
jgi:hypothetical protein